MVKGFLMLNLQKIIQNDVWFSHGGYKMYEGYFFSMKISVGCLAINIFSVSGFLKLRRRVSRNPCADNMHFLCDGGGSEL